MHTHTFKTFTEHAPDIQRCMYTQPFYGVLSLLLPVLLYMSLRVCAYLRACVRCVDLQTCTVCIPIKWLDLFSEKLLSGSMSGLMSGVILHVALSYLLSKKPCPYPISQHTHAYAHCDKCVLFRYMNNE